MNCEMCGTETSLITALIEGVELKVCKNCASFGKTLKKPVMRKARIVNEKPEKEIIEGIVDDFPKIIKEKREKMGLKQKELAKFLAERESIIHKMESGNYTPTIELARKLEKQLNIVLIEEKEIISKGLKSKTENLTIGDMIKTK